MLEKLLEEIRKGGTLQPSRLAARLNTNTAMVEMMLADLERLGILKPINKNCGDSCGGCPMTGNCSSQDNNGRLRMLIRQNPIRQL